MIARSSVVLPAPFGPTMPMRSPCTRNNVRSLISVSRAIVSGFLIVGSPTKQRNLRFDGERASDLQNIQYQIVTYWQQKQKLPTSLTEIVNPISGNYVPTDPENKTSYGYTIKGDKSFELCATFTLKMQDTSSMTYPAYPDNAQNHNWTHNAGRTCFARTIDVQIYPPYGAPEKVLY